jgi:hypothetical protein
MGVLMSTASEIHSPEVVKPARWDFGLWLLLVLPAIALLVCLAVGLKSVVGTDQADFGYDQWLPAQTQADANGR